MPLPTCPDNLPEELTQLVRAFGDAWAASPVRPSPDKDVLEHWSTLVASWANDASLPLLVRKHRTDRGSTVQHETGRVLVPTDNSAAHWAFTLAYEGQRPTLKDIQTWFDHDEIPLAMIQKSAERQTAAYHCRLNRAHNVNLQGWKLAHIQPAGLRTQTSLSRVPLEELKTKFINFLTPANMFVVPLPLAGLGETQPVIDALVSGRR